MKTMQFTMLVTGLFISSVSGALTAQTKEEVPRSRITEPVMRSEVKSSRKWTKEVSVDSFRVVLSLQPMEQHIKAMVDLKDKAAPMLMDLATTHNISVTLFRQGQDKPMKDAKVSLKVKGPKGQELAQELSFIEGLNNYNGDFNFSEKGKYQLTCFFEVDGSKKQAVFFYEVK